MDNHPTNENKVGATGEEDPGSSGDNDQLIHRAQSIALATYTQQMDVVFSSPSSPTNPSPFTYVQIKNYHDAIIANIMDALEQTNSSIFNQIQTHLSKVFSTQLAIYQNRNELIVEKWAERVTQATREVENWYEAQIVKQWGTKLLQIKKIEEFSSEFKDLHESVQDEAILQFSMGLNLSPSDKNDPQAQSPLLKQIIFLLNEKKEELQENLMLQLQQNISARKPTISKKPEINVEELEEVKTPYTGQNFNENEAYPSSKIGSQEDAGSSKQAAPDPQSQLPPKTQIKRSNPVQSPRQINPTVPKEVKANDQNLQEIPTQKDNIKNPRQLSVKTGSEEITRKPLTQSKIPDESFQSESDRPTQEAVISNHPDRKNSQISEGTRTPNIPGTPVLPHKIPNPSNVSAFEENSSNHHTNNSVTDPSKGKLVLQDSKIQQDKRQNQGHPLVTEIESNPTTRQMTASDQNSPSASPSMNPSQGLDDNRKTTSSSIQPLSLLQSDNVSSPRPKEVNPMNSPMGVTDLNQKAINKTEQQFPLPKSSNAPDSQNTSVPPQNSSKLLLLITRSKLYLKLINQIQNSSAILQEVEEIPPYVQIDEKRILVGKEAKDANIPNVTFNFNVLQLLLGKSRTVPLGPKRTLSVEEIIAGFFRELNKSIVRKSGGKIDGHAIIYPASLTNFQLRTLTIAAKLGGCTPLRTMSFHLAHAIALASQMSTKMEKIKKLEKILLIHMTCRTFEAIVANVSFESSGQTLSSVSVESYASFEDQRNIELLQFQHLELIKQVQRGEVSENTQSSTLHNYKQIMAAAFSTTIHKDVYFIFEEKLESMAPILQKEIFKNKNVINVREIDVLREAELLVQCIFSSKSSVNNKSLHVSDVYTRSFGFWKPKIALADPSISPKQKSAFNHFIKLVKLSDMVKSLLNKPTDFMEAMDLIEMQVKNQSVPLRITLHEAAYDVTGGNRICEFILGSKLEQEVYSFEYERNHVAPFKLQVRLSSDDGLYTLHLTDQTGRPVEIKNRTFRHLDLLIRECTEAETA